MNYVCSHTVWTSSICYNTADFVYFHLVNLTFCRFSGREAAAVSDWLSSDLPFHIMRDHTNHGVQMLAGMWGAKLVNGTRDRYGEMLKKILQEVGFCI